MMNPFRKRFGVNGGKVVVGAYVMFNPPGPEATEERPEILAAFGTVHNKFGLVVRERFPIACEVHPITGVHDCGQIESVSSELLTELGRRGTERAVWLETDSPRFKKVQVAWATVF